MGEIALPPPDCADTLADVLAAMAGNFTGSLLAAEVAARAIVAAIAEGRVRNVTLSGEINQEAQTNGL